ncbi:prolyl oligopeptidase family serine peptidase [Sporosarcina sp. P33]|uniref:S9 family peptidase n=1 Tax=Sporosarcina sp. P33 TaxID=1930764 RepID=UPI0009BE0E91|nr:prolyl oligopeptidase family serine peptidase [Sporosarcina sp. P33]ARD48267.1 peptidase S9 [Sporosarcina sp. P33]
MSDEEILVDFLNVNSAFQSQAISGESQFTFLSKFTGKAELWTLNEENKPVQVIETPDRVMDVYHGPKGDWTVIGMDYKGNEKQQIYAYRTDAEIKELIPLVVSPDHFHHIGGWSPNGKFLSFSSNRRAAGFFDVFIVDIETKEIKKVYSHDANCIPVSWIDDENIIVSSKVTNIDSTLSVVHIHNGSINVIGNQDVSSRYEMPIADTISNNVYMLSDYKEETLHLCRFSVDQPAQIEKLLHWEKWDMEEISFSPEKELLAFTLNEGGINRLGFYSPQLKACELADGIPKGVISSMSWLTNEILIFTLKTPIAPGDIWSYDVASKKVNRLTFIGQSKTVGKFWCEPELRIFHSFDGLEVPYFFYNKDASVNQPAVIYVHGGPESQTKAEYNPVVQYLVHKGMAVAAPNIRGSNGYGRSFLQMDDADKRLDAVEDLACLAKELTATHQVAEDKIGIIGRSYGGFMVLAALTHYPNLWAAGVDIVGMSNLKTFLQNTGEWRRYLRESEYGSLEQYSKYFDKIAPMNLTDKIQAPLLVFHGRNDTRVPVSEAQQLVDDLQSRKSPVKFIVFEDEGHHTEKTANQITMHMETVAFFDRYLRK